jgi:hypothetical protein
MFRRLSLAIAAALLYLAPCAGRAQVGTGEGTVTITPSSFCTRVLKNGVRSCSATVAWDKGTGSYTNYALFLAIADQKTGWINAPWPGQKIWCNSSGAGTHAFDLPRVGIYRFVFFGTNMPCPFLTGTTGAMWLLADGDIYVQ